MKKEYLLLGAGLAAYFLLKKPQIAETPIGQLSPTGAVLSSVKDIADAFKTNVEIEIANAAMVAAQTGAGIGGAMVAMFPDVLKTAAVPLFTPAIAPKAAPYTQFTYADTGITIPISEIPAGQLNSPANVFEMAFNNDTGQWYSRPIGGGSIMMPSGVYS